MTRALKDLPPEELKLSLLAKKRRPSGRYLVSLVASQTNKTLTGVIRRCGSTLWCQLEDMFQLIVTPQGIEKVMIQLKDTPTKVYAIGAELFYQRCP